MNCLWVGSSETMPRFHQFDRFFDRIVLVENEEQHHNLWGPVHSRRAMDIDFLIAFHHFGQKLNSSHAFLNKISLVHILDSISMDLQLVTRALLVEVVLSESMHRHILTCLDAQY